MMRIARIRFSFLILSIFFTAFAALADGFFIAPHLQNVTPDGATLIWETQDEGIGAVEYGLEGQFDKQAAEAGPAKVHRVRITGLTPDTAFSYRIHAGTDVRTNTFKTAPGSERAITFVAMGDSRRWDKRWQETRMGEHMMQWNPEFVINNGDLVVEGHKHELWPEHFERFSDFNGKIMMLSTRGNHEGARRAGDENDWFARYHELPGGGEPFSVFDWGNTHFVLVSSDSVMTSPEELDRLLAEAKKRYSFVVFHFPVYSTGYASPDDSRKQTGKDLAALWKVFDRHNVTLHLSGHTHTYERTWPLRDGKRGDRGGTTYIVQGGDINCNYPDVWTAFSDDRETTTKPTYTLFRCKDDRVELSTFAWSTVENKIVEIDRSIICHDEAVPAALLADLPNQTGDARIKVIDDLGAMIYGPAAKALLPFLSDADVKTRQAAATAIRSIGNADVAEDLVAHLKDADPVVRRESARALEIAMPDTLASDVAEQAKDAAQDPATRVSLIGALQFHAPAKLARETLVKLLQGDAPPNVRRRAAYALTRVVEKGDVRAIAKLFDKEPEPFAAQRLAYTLNLLTGKHLSLNDKQSAPGHRAQLVKEWLSN